MEEKETSLQDSSASSTLYYGIGAAVFVLLVAGIYLMRPKAAPTTPSPVPSPARPSGATGAPLLTKPTGPITALACELQYYNPMIGFKKYYLSAEGSDVPAATNVDCNFTVSVGGKVVAKTTVKDVPLTSEPSRNGKSFRCTSKAVELEPNVPTVVDVAIVDNQKKETSCSATFLLPAP